MYLFEQAAFLYHIGHGLHFDALGFIDVFQGIELMSLLVLDNTNLRVIRRRESVKRPKHRE